MDRSRLVVNLACLACAAIALVLLPRPAAAQDVTAQALKAEYIYRFAEFTQWPADVMGPETPLLICVVGDGAVSEELQRQAKGRMLFGRRANVLLLAPEAPRGTCHILYISGVTAGQAAKVIAGLRDSPVLTISDVEGFSANGGIVEFYVRGTLRFSVLLAAMKRARLQISSRLLFFAIPR